MRLDLRSSSHACLGASLCLARAPRRRGVLSSACAWSVPANPGLNARERGRVEEADLSGAPAGGPATPAPAAGIGGGGNDAATRALYLAKCGQCHAPWSPRHATAAEWPSLVRKYGPRAGLFGEDRERVVRYLQANAR